MNKEEKYLSNENLQQLVEKISLEIFQQPFTHQAIFNSRLKTTGGRYHLGDHHLDFNPAVLQEHGLEEFTKIIKHELCHYHLHLAGKGYRHRDSDFRDLLHKTGGARYTMPLKSTQSSKRHVYQCKECKQSFQRKKKVNIQKYACPCGGHLQYIDTHHV